MADDDMLMNFSLGDTPLSVKPVFKGGRWRDRLIEKKRAHARHEYALKRGVAQAHDRVDVQKEASGNDDLDERPPKKQKLSGPYKQSAAPRVLKEVVSSLFTYNPSSNTPAQPAQEDEAPVKPSNAPLVDGLDTFTTLGLSSLLAVHLLTKLNLKAPTAIQKAAISQLIKEDSDAFIQAETGSGKTLAYLLPIVQRITELSKYKDAGGQTADGLVHRDSGLFAIVLAPTRELCKQISVVLQSLLRCAHWIVAGTVLGGEKKKSEKARLRKGLNILIATPGRLVDHLLHTETLDVSNVRWLVLDEGDRLMELGFEEEIRAIVAKLEGRGKSAKEKVPGLPSRRTTILCSATMKMNVQRLGEISLKDAVHIKADANADEINDRSSNGDADGFSAPAQLRQSYVLVPPKQRLVTLAALLKRTFARQGSVMKAIVFLSCADSVDFHFEIFGRNVQPKQNAEHSDSSTVEEDAAPKPLAQSLPTVRPAPLLTSPSNPKLTVYKLHGSLAQPIRTSTLGAFSRTTDPSILLCTDVASRGLDLPSIDLVIEYDPPFAAADHLHRVGRTARAGRDGRATIFLMPGPEEGYVEILKRGYKDGTAGRLRRTEAEEALKKGFGVDSGIQKKGSAREWEDKATEWQLEIERWVIEDRRLGEMARKAYVSHVRAYATHVVAEREMFDVKGLHLGHLAKAFALRDRPGSMGRGGNSSKGARRTSTPAARKGRIGKGGDEDEGADVDRREAARKMRMTMRQHMAGANEFNIG